MSTVPPTDAPDTAPQIDAADVPDVADVENLSLAADFPAATRDAWEELVAGVLRKAGRFPDGADVREASTRLETTTPEGITIEPLYVRSDAPAEPGWPGVAPFVRGRTAVGGARDGWDIRQRHAHPDPAVTREAILTDLENGVTSLWLVLGDGAIAVEDLAAVLTDVFLDLAPVALDAGAAAAQAAETFLAVSNERGIAPAQLRGNLGFDPLGAHARTGSPADLSEAVAWAQRCDADLPGIRAITVDALPYDDAGGSDAQQLGASLAAGVTYLRALTDAGLSAEQACNQLEFRYAASADQFLTIAKFRAARRLWARVAEVCGVPAKARGQRQHGVSSWAMTTRRDPWVNMIRGTLACFGAGVGGADAVTVLPYDTAIGLPDVLARRVARNTQSLLVQESNLSRVVDPAGGSWYVESLTDQLATKAWGWFQELDAAGGLAAALNSGFVAEELAKTAAARTKRLAVRKDTVTGVSEFPFLDERTVERPAAAAPASGGLPRLRYAEPYEALRDRSDAHLAKTGARPQVFLAGLGSARDQSARVTFAEGALLPGGIVPITSAATTLDALGEEFADATTTAAVLCSTDAVYADHAADAARILKKAGATRVLLAGRPGAQEQAYRDAGIDGFLYVGADILAALTDLDDALGVPA